MDFYEKSLKAEREHIEKNRADLEAYKETCCARVDSAEKAERRVKEHLREYRKRNEGMILTYAVIRVRV